MPLQVQTGEQPVVRLGSSQKMESNGTPRVYAAEQLPGYWIAEGTDGQLYMMPSQPGGWLRGDQYDGERDELEPVAPHEARYIVWFTYGDTGPVRIAEG